MKVFLLLEEAYPDSIYSFKVTALNGGGESFPSEVVSACRASESKGQVLIISAFDRTGGAAWFEDEAHAGFMPMIDQGVPWQMDLHTVGAQYDYLKASPWLDDDAPGFGASYADLEGLVIPGNTFDFPLSHGISIGRAGYSFVSISDEAIEEDSLDLQDMAMIDFIAGEERTTYLPKNDSLPLYQVFSPLMLDQLSLYLEQGGSIFISGAHIASDVHLNGQDSLVASLSEIQMADQQCQSKG